MGSSQTEEYLRNPTPPLEEDQLIVNAVDIAAKVKPQAIYAEFPVSSTSYDEGFRTVNYERLANAVNGLAWWLTAQIGKSKLFDTLIYTGPNDFRQNAMILACVKTGYKLLLASPRNQVSALKSLLEAVDCKYTLGANLNSPLVSAIQEAKPMPVFQIPSVEVLLEETFPHYAYNRTFEKAKHDPILILHTSGTTNVPKPITYTNDWATVYTRALRLEAPTGTVSNDILFRQGRLFVMMPAFHGANIFPNFFCALTSQTTIVFPPANLPPTIESFLGGIQATQVDVAFIPPHFIPQIASNPQYLDFVSQHVTTIISGGGAIPKPAGQVLSSRIKFFTKYASTEMGSLPCTRPSGSWTPENWNCITPHPETGIEFQFHSHDNEGDMYEACIRRNHSNSDNEQPIFKLFPKIHEFRTRDLFRRHPHSTNQWEWCGRVDDTIVLSTGANISPVIMEEGLARHPDIRAVLMVGNGRLRPALMIEGKNEDTDLCEVSESLWDTIEELNGEYCEDHRITRSHVLFVDGGIPMARSAKGTIQRATTVELYEKRLEELYVTADAV
ncbi:NRPS-like enzyme [Sclerotinia borealis F-4128]|uniref:NRPS-like enzyme n=1 Tax=Sclerotinia borealis (strain F-4128) TaxID=1432307 RepID=W9C8X6_SCLBF|nr:NRPS-like enzyme [Sclerotinia borealis F-4128]